MSDWQADDDGSDRPRRAQEGGIVMSRRAVHRVPLSDVAPVTLGLGMAW